MSAQAIAAKNSSAHTAAKTYTITKAGVVAIFVTMFAARMLVGITINKKDNPAIVSKRDTAFFLYYSILL